MPDQKPDEIAIFAAAAEMPADEQGDFLDEACQGDAELRARLASYLSCAIGPGPLDAVLTRSELTVEQPPALKTVGYKIGPYKIREKIAEGGMGEVYVAEQSKPVRRKVALKVIRPGLAGPNVVARFEAERQALAMMDHSNIARVLDGGATEDQLPYFVMELVQGLPITEYCDQRQLTTRERLELFLPVCRAVQHAHQKGIIHRDLKPSNVLVAEIDGVAVPKVIDFGVAKALHQKLTEQTVYTQFSQLVGTPLYMSPEQAGLGVIDVDTRSDVYSLGVLLYELLTGTTPFEKERLQSATFDEMRRIIREEEPSRPSAVVSTLAAKQQSTLAEQRRIDPRRLCDLLRGELDWLVMKALEKDRNRRYESVSALADDIGRYLRDERVEACPPSLGYRLRKYVKRNTVALVTASAVAAALLLGFIGTSWQAWRATKALRERTIALNGKDAALQQANTARERAEKNERLAEAEQQRAEENLALAIHAVEETYLGSISEDTLRPYELFPWMPGRTGQAVLTDAERDQIKKGLEFYEQIAQQNPSSQQARFQAARAYSRVGLLRKVLRENEIAERAYSEAIAQLSSLADDDPTRFEYKLELSRAIYLKGTLSPFWPDASDIFERAVLTATQAIELSPESTDAIHLRGRALLALSTRDSWNQALEDFRRIVSIRPNDADAQKDLAQVVLMMRGEHDSEHIEILERAFELNPRDGVIARTWEKWVNDRDRAIAFYEQRLLSATERERKPELLLKIAVLRGEHRKVIELTSEQLELNPNAFTNYIRRAEAYGHLGDSARKLADLQHAEEIILADHVADPGGWNLLSIAKRYSGLGFPDLERALLRKTIELFPYNPTGYRYRAESVLGTGGSEEEILQAIEGLDHGFRLNPYETRFIGLRAQLQLKLGRFNEALADFRRMLELASQDGGQISFLFALNKSELDKCPDDEFREGYKQLQRDVLQILSQRIESEPDKAHLYLDRSQVFQQLVEMDKALADLDRAVELDPANVERWNRRGNFHRERGNLQAAIADYDRAIELNPNSDWPLANRAATHRKLGNLDKALADYSLATELHPGMTEAWIGRAFTQIELGHFDSAIGDLEHMLELAPAESFFWYSRAMLELKCDQESLYRATCGRMLDHFLDSDDPQAARWLAWTCALRPDALDNLGPCVALVQAAAEKVSGDESIVSSLGAILYRDDQFAEAATCLIELDASWKKNPDAVKSSPAYVWFFLAMAHHQLGDSVAAENWLSKAMAQADQELSQESVSWNRKLTLELLRDEATMLIHGAGKQALDDNN